MDRNVAAGYDPTGESILDGKDLADIGDEEEDEEDVQTDGAERDNRAAAEDSADDGDEFPDILAEESDEVGVPLSRSSGLFGSSSPL